MMDLAESLRSQGLNSVEDVGEIMDGRAEPTGRPAPLQIPMLDDYPVEWPGEGIFFDMPEDVYHAVPALSAGGIKSMAGSSMIYWAKCPWMNPRWAEIKRKQEEKRQKDGADHFKLGHAYHCRLLEGASAYATRFAIGLDRADYPDCLESTDEIKNAIIKLEHKPISRVGLGEFVDDPKKPGQAKELTRPAVKADWIAQLRELDPTAQIWSVLESEFREANDGKQFVTADQNYDIELIGGIIERDPEVAPLLQGGEPEVSLFWICPKSGVPKKARADKLKVRMMVDLKTIANQKEMSIENAIRLEISNRKYPIQPSHYFEGAEEVRKLVRKHGASVCHGSEEQVAYALKWAKHQLPDEWWWVFLQKGIAPIARGVEFHRASTNKMLADDVCSRQSRRFREFCEAFGTAPWVDRAPRYTIADEDLTQYATEI